MSIVVTNLMMYGAVEPLLSKRIASATHNTQHKQEIEMSTTMDDEKITGMRIVAWDNYTNPDRRVCSDYVWDNDIDQVSIAMALDNTNAIAIKQSGCSGMGSGAELQLVFSDDDADDINAEAEKIDSMDHLLVRRLPQGKAKYLRKFISESRDKTCWNGNNNISYPTYESENLLDEIRNGV